MTDLVLGDDAILPLSEIGLEIPLAEIYVGVEFACEPAGENVLS